MSATEGVRVNPGGVRVSPGAFVCARGRGWSGLSQRVPERQLARRGDTREHDRAQEVSRESIQRGWVGPGWVGRGWVGRGARVRGRRWQTGQKAAERFMNDSRTIGVPHRGHGRPSRP